MAGIYDRAINFDSYLKISRAFSNVHLRRNYYLINVLSYLKDVLCSVSKFMNDVFTIIIDNEPLEVRKLNFKNYYAAFEIWKQSEIQFILVHDKDKNVKHAWNIHYAESSGLNQEYIDKVINAIDSHYS